VVKEALRCKRPVVSTDVGDVADWIDQGESGSICEHSASSLGQGVLETTRIIREGRYRQGTRIDSLDEQAIMAQVLRLYRRLAAV
jgi:glycosyltransferase involved in cell wall biosynthesis